MLKKIKNGFMENCHKPIPNLFTSSFVNHQMKSRPKLGKTWCCYTSTKMRNDCSYSQGQTKMQKLSKTIYQSSNFRHHYMPLHLSMSMQAGKYTIHQLYMDNKTVLLSRYITELLLNRICKESPRQEKNIANKDNNPKFWIGSP